MEDKLASSAANLAKDWKIFQGNLDPHDGLKGLVVPPWRRSDPITVPESFPDGATARDETKAAPFIPDTTMIAAVNTALYLRRPLLLTGKPGTGKSTLISKVARELKMGPVLRWDITSRSTVRSGIYDYDAVGRLRNQPDGAAEAPIEQFLTIGPLGTAMLGTTWPRALLIDEIDKGDIDLANDLLNVIEEGAYDIPELRRMGNRTLMIKDGFNCPIAITQGHLECRQFPFVVMTSNAEREFPPPFLRRCIRLTIQPPDNLNRLSEIVNSHLSQYLSNRASEVNALIQTFLEDAKGKELATDQLLNAVFLTIGMNNGTQVSFDSAEITDLRKLILEKIA
jgi:MoxR-like ATPase